MPRPRLSLLQHGLRLAALLLLCALALQGVFAARIALLAVFDPSSTSFQRSEAWRLLRQPGAMVWRQQWVALDSVSKSLQRAVIASEDAGFVEHRGVEWEAIERARERNRRATGRVQQRSDPDKPVAVRLVGGSTITQQLAKNLLLSGERTVWRKGQELLLTWMLEALLDKARILEIYLNHVEWGEGVFGAQAAARQHFGVDAARLNPAQAARLAVMLPAPKRYEKRPSSNYLSARAATIQARMGAVALP